MTTREAISLGTYVNDGTGDSLRDAGGKINRNFEKLFLVLGSDSDTLYDNLIQLSTLVITPDVYASGDISVINGYTIFDSATAFEASLPDGTLSGTQKIFTNRGAGTATITPVSFGQGTSIALAQNAGCTMTWDSANWYVVSGYPDSDITLT